MMLVSCATVRPLAVLSCDACGVNTSSGDVFEIGVPSYRLTAGVGQTESWGG